jgi:hypothetical protein
LKLGKDREKAMGFAKDIKRRYAAWRVLRAFGYPRPHTARWGGYFPILITLLLIVAIVSGWVPIEDATGNRQAAVTGAIGVGALYLGFQQWRASRREISLDKFYERLLATNQKLKDWPAARPFAGPWNVDGNADAAEENCHFQRKMYIYLELDNLEYSLAKYRIGYMTSEDAYRGLMTFCQRCCASPEFREGAEKAVENIAYDSYTCEVVAKVSSWARKDPAEWYAHEHLTRFLKHIDEDWWRRVAGAREN